MKPFISSGVLPCARAMEHRHLFSRFKDYRGRTIRIDDGEEDNEHFINPNDGRLKPLEVQVDDGNLLRTEPGLRWKRTRLSTPGSSLDRILYWTWSSMETKAQRSRLLFRSSGLEVALKWIPSCIIIFLLFFIPQRVGGIIQNNGDYEPVREKDRHYAKVARNPFEDDPNGARRNSNNTVDTADYVPLSHFPGNETFEDEVEKDMIHEAENDHSYGLVYRPLRPRFLCHIIPNDDLDNPKRSYEVRSGEGTEEYVFVSYTRSAFHVKDTDERYQDIVQRDRKTILRAALFAAKDAGVNAFWVDFEGIRQQGEDNEDVYRICDVLRGAKCMALINGGPWQNKEVPYIESDHQAWLRKWASRTWVLPELLLAPMDRRIAVYTQKHGVLPEDVQPEECTKRDLARISCQDALDVRHLVEHYEGNTLLTPLELVQLALRCLHRRRKETTPWTKADLAYALKGLLRRRPKYVEDESGFEAFASLSLVNDSQKLLERIINMLPPDPLADWSDMRDDWGVQVWDIEPSCQVAGIVNEKTVLLDGVRGASIRWNRLEKVAFVTKNTPFRLFAKFIIRGIPIWLICSVLLLVANVQLLQKPDVVVDTAKIESTCETYVVCVTKEFLRELGDAFHRWARNSSTPMAILGGICCLVTLMIAIASPYLLYKLYHGKFWNTQAWLLGIEGDVEDLADIERRLFGVCEGRLTWSPNGSRLSRHHKDPATEERVADRPLGRDTVHKPLTQIKSGASSEPEADADVPAPTVWASRQRLFTLVDTYTLTVTQFFAFHPPTAMFICGQEGGMQRAVLCSYDWKNHTWCKESVLRVKTLVLEKMPRVDRFQFSMKR